MGTYLDHIDDVFLFGKFTGCTLAEVLTYNPGYIQWVAENVSIAICAISENALLEIKLVFPDFPITSEIEMQNLNYYTPEDDEEVFHEKDDFDRMYEERTYARYNGSFAQDFMGYSDDDIDTIFDGDPEAYWNID